MPKLKETEWDKITNDISIISFLQGLNIGGKVYNGHSIVTNTKNKEVVSEDSIYVTTKATNTDGSTEYYYHKPTEMNLNSKNIISGVLNIDFERKSMKINEQTKYFYPNKALASYASIVNQTDVDTTDNIYDYLTDGIKNNVAKAYFTALGRERYSMYKTNNNKEELIKQFSE